LKTPHFLLFTIFSASLVGSAQNTVDVFRIHYNFVREHGSIKKTPAEKAGIRLELGEKKLENLIKLASRNQFK